MFHLLQKLLEAVATSALPDVQEELLSQHGEAGKDKWNKTSTYPSEEHTVKFWLLNDGSAVHVPQMHAKGGWQSGGVVNPMMYDELIDSGAVRTNGLLKSGVLVLEFKKNMTDAQVKWLVDFSEYNRLGRVQLTQDEHYFSSIIKSPEHLEWILTASPSERKQLEERKVKIAEASLNAIRRKQRSITNLFPTFNDRVNKVKALGGIRLRSVDDDVWNFRLHSGTKTDTWYDAVLHFKDVQETLEPLVKDRRLWTSDKARVDLRKLASKFIENVNVRVFCSCPAFLYWGPAYILSKNKYQAKYTHPELRKPVKRNPKELGAVCKHCSALFQALPFYVADIAKWLKDFYSKDIAGYEREARKEFGMIQKQARALGKKKVEVEKGKPAPKTKEAEKKPVEEKPAGKEPTETEERPE